MIVYCASSECKYNSNTGRCTAKRVDLTWHSISTVWDGRQEFWKCKQYEKSAEYSEMEKRLSKWLTTKR